MPPAFFAGITASLVAAGVSTTLATTLTCPACATGAVDCHHEPPADFSGEVTLQPTMSAFSRTRGDCTSPVVEHGDTLVWSHGEIEQGDVVVVKGLGQHPACKIWAGSVEYRIIGVPVIQDVLATTRPEGMYSLPSPFRLRVRHVLRNGELIEINPVRTLQEHLASILSRHGPRIDFVATTAVQKLPAERERRIEALGGIPDDMRLELGLAPRRA